MQTENVAKKLETIKDAILSLSDGFEGDGSMQNIDQSFAEIEEDLRGILDQINQMDKPARDQLSPTLTQFRTEIEVRYEDTKERLEALQREMDAGKTHIKAIKAYARH
ncbi:MAG: hypothetical protein NTX76_05985 [Alphaproteobacteria bacterium]|nr:hypothetical protein [Alphaproteobacteria bacterium]